MSPIVCWPRIRPVVLRLYGVYVLLVGGAEPWPSFQCKGDLNYCGFSCPSERLQFPPTWMRIVGMFIFSRLFVISRFRVVELHILLLPFEDSTYSVSIHCIYIYILLVHGFGRIMWPNDFRAAIAARLNASHNM